VDRTRSVCESIYNAEYTGLCAAYSLAVLRHTGDINPLMHTAGPDGVR